MTKQVNEPYDFKSISEDEGQRIDILADLISARLNANISQETMAKKLNMSTSELDKIETLDDIPEWSALKHYASGLGME